jgi:hypothetical protein
VIITYFFKKKRIIFHRKLAKLVEISDNNIFFQEKRLFFHRKLVASPELMIITRVFKESAVLGENR